MATLMLVEDEEDLRFLVSHNLSQAGHEVVQAEDGVRALEVLQRVTPDLIVADVAMPRMDGFELCRRVREIDRLQHVPFLFLTARTDSTSLYKGLKLGASDYLKKPIELDELLARVEGRLDASPKLSSSFEATHVVAPRPSPMPPAPLPTVVEPGCIINERYRIEKLLGQGAIGRVYLATQLSIGREVALKWMFAPPEHYGPKGLQRFKREAELASRIVHPNVVPVHDFGIEATSQTPFLVMGLVSGRTLRDVLQDGRMGLSRALSIAIQIARALDAAHQQSIIHRDLKAANVMLCETSQGPQVTVLDFGLARAVGGPEAAGLTASGDLVGTPMTMSPEQARGEKVGPPTDLYALGCVLHELLTGERAFQGGSVFEILSRHTLGPRPQLPADEAYPQPLLQLHQQLLAIAAADRPESAAAVVKTLVAVRDELD